MNNKLATITLASLTVLGVGTVSACSGDGSNSFGPLSEQDVPEVEVPEVGEAPASDEQPGDGAAIDDFDRELDAWIDAGLGTDVDWLDDGR